jgi:hypothetical protein
VELLQGRSVKVGTKVLPRRLEWFNQNLKLMMYCVGEVDGGGVGKADHKETAEDKEGPPEMIEMETKKGKVIDDDDDVKAVEKATTAVDASTEDKVTEGTKGKYLNLTAWGMFVEDDIIQTNNTAGTIK